MPNLCRVRRCRNRPVSLCMWIWADELAKNGLALYCEEHTESFKLLGAIKILKVRR